MCETLAANAAQIAWWHGGMELGDGVVTKGPSMPAKDLLPRLNLPADLTGKTVLDIGTWDGFMAFECERRGAKKVVAVDSYVWDVANAALPWSTGRAGFDLAHAAYASKVEAVECEVLDLSPDALGTFDIVLFLGVLYHMRHPLLALERVAAMTADLLIVESHVITDKANTPLMRFYPGDELNKDGTNWWGPNACCIEAMLCDVGFAHVQIVSQGADRIALHARRVQGAA
jgi:tRNA (mo5U34)-methyltransferase